jgi:hypothetical protein
VKKSKKILEGLNFKDLKLSQSEIRTCLKLCQFELNSQPCYVGKLKESATQPIILLNPYQLAGKPLSETIDLYGEELDVNKILQFQDEVAYGFQRFRTLMYQVRHQTILVYHKWKVQEGSVPHPGQLCVVRNLVDQEAHIGSQKRLRLCLIKELVPGKDGKPPSNAMVQFKDRRRSDFTLETKEVSLRNLAPLMDKDQLSLDLREFQVKAKDLQNLQYEVFPQGHCQLEQESKKYQREKTHVPVKITSIPQEEFDQLNKKLGGSKKRRSKNLEQYEPQILPEKLITGKMEAGPSRLRTMTSTPPLRNISSEPKKLAISRQMDTPLMQDLERSRKSADITKPPDHSLAKKVAATASSDLHLLNKNVMDGTGKRPRKPSYTETSPTHATSMASIPTELPAKRSLWISGCSKVIYPI